MRTGMELGILDHSRYSVDILNSVNVEKKASGKPGLFSIILPM